MGVRDLHVVPEDIGGFVRVGDSEWSVSDFEERGVLPEFLHEVVSVVLVLEGNEGFPGEF